MHTNLNKTNVSVCAYEPETDVNIYFESQLCCGQHILSKSPLVVKDNNKIQNEYIRNQSRGLGNLKLFPTRQNKFKEQKRSNRDKTFACTFRNRNYTARINNLIHKIRETLPVKSSSKSQTPTIPF